MQDGTEKKEGEADAATDAAADSGAKTEGASGNNEVQPLRDITNQKNKTDEDEKNTKKQRERRERGPPADGIPSKTKVMVANLPYDLTEEKVRVKKATTLRLGC